MKTKVGVCREKSVEKLDAFKDQITIVQAMTNDRTVIEKAVNGCDGVLFHARLERSLEWGC